jgi:ATP-dependent exoDNAse (exonuclease V) beta subunit
MDEAAIFTIHGFCQRMLNLNAFESGMLFEQELIEDDLVKQQLMHRIATATANTGQPQLMNIFADTSAQFSGAVAVAIRCISCCLTRYRI